MTTIDRILIPTDFSSEAENACFITQKLASAYGAQVDFLYVIPGVVYIDEQQRNKAHSSANGLLRLFICCIQVRSSYG